MTTSFVRWAGSKRKLLPALLRCAPSRFERYVEPFVGSACLFFALAPRQALLSDFNEDLITAYRVVRHTPAKVARMLSECPVTASEYLRVRAQDPTQLSRIDRAVRFLYLNRLCFNGVYRTNRRGEFNVPMGSRTGAMPTGDMLRRCARMLRHATLVRADFEKALTGVGAGDFVYLDPPYATADRPAYGEYGYDCFGEEDVQRLAEVVRRLDRAGAVVLISYSHSDILRRALRGWSVRELAVRREIAADAGHRRASPEVLVSNRPLPRRSTLLTI